MIEQLFLLSGVVYDDLEQKLLFQYGLTVDHRIFQMYFLLYRCGKRIPAANQLLFGERIRFLQSLFGMIRNLCFLGGFQKTGQRRVRGTSVNRFPRRLGCA